MDDNKEDVWDRLKYVPTPRERIYLGNGVYVADWVTDNSTFPSAPIMITDKDEVWRKLSETQEQRNQRFISELFDDAKEELERLKLFRDGKKSTKT